MISFILVIPLTQVTVLFLSAWYCRPSYQCVTAVVLGVTIILSYFVSLNNDGNDAMCPPGGFHLLSCLAEFGDSRQSMLQAGVVPALISLANKTPDAHTCASATSLLRLLTNSTDRRSTDGIHGSGLDPAGDFGANVSGADGSSGRGAGGYLSRGPCRDMYRQHRSHAFQGFFQI